MIERVSDLFPETLESHDLRIASIPQALHDDHRRYTSGLENVDDAAGLLQPGSLCVIGAREGQGKTSLAERIAMQNSFGLKHRVLFVSLDMRAEVVKERILSKSMLVGGDSVRFQASQETEDYKRATKRLEQHDLMVWRPRKGAKTVQHIMDRAEAISAAIVIIDYCRLIDGWDYGRKAADIIDVLADWAHDSRIVTVLLTQLRDEAVNKRPHNGHIQDTSQIAQRADRITLIYRPFIGRRDRDTIAEIITTKNRWGPPGKNHAGWIGETMDFYSLCGEDEANAKCCQKTSH